MPSPSDDVSVRVQVAVPRPMPVFASEQLACAPDVETVCEPDGVTPAAAPTARTAAAQVATARAAARRRFVVRIVITRYLLVAGEPDTRSLPRRATHVVRGGDTRNVTPATQEIDPRQAGYPAGTTVDARGDDGPEGRQAGHEA